jgi:peroxiredoxin
VRVDPDSLRISQLINGAPGERAGLLIGDQLKSVDREPVLSARSFVERVRGTERGKTLAIAVTREGAEKTFAVEVAPRPESLAKSSLVGKPAPQLTTTALADQATLKLADLRGHVVVLDFWATWCVPCTYTIPRLNELHDKHAAKGLRIVGFSGEDPDVIRAFVAQQAIGYMVAHDVDDTIAKLYLREGIPMFVVIDKAGVVRDVIVGADVDGLAAAIAPLLGS